MSQELNEILDSFENILSKNKSFVNEVSASSTSLLGGKNVKIPRAGAHAGQSGWQSSNAWDIAAPVGTPVYALADGVAQTFSDYGRNIIKTGGKKLYGQSFTVKSKGNLPDVYYTHIERSPIKKGSKIQCGQFLGYIMDMPNSSYDHVHIGISSGDISQFLTQDGRLRCGGGKITGDFGDYKATSDTDTESDSGTGSPENTSNTPIQTPYGTYSDFGDIIGGSSSLNESFGKNLIDNYGSIIIPARSNEKIKSGVPGSIVKSRYASDCKNQILIELQDNKGYIRYCGITSPSSFRNGSTIQVGTLLGKTQDDVTVTYFDRSFSKKQLKGDSKFSKDLDNDSDYEKKRQKNVTEPTYYDPALAAIPTMITSLFKDKVDPETGAIEKRMGYPTDKKQVDPWIVTSISKPFEKIGKFLGTNKSAKLQENIERIKKLL